MGEAAGGSSGTDAEGLFNSGLDHHDRGEYDEAIRCYKRVVELEPKMVVAHNNLGMVYIDKAMFDLAVVELARTIDLDESYAEAYNNLGFVFRRMGEEPKAAALYDKFLTLEPDVEDGPKIREWLENVRAACGSLPSVKELISAAVPAEQPAEQPSGPADGISDLDITGENEMGSLLAEAIESARAGPPGQAAPAAQGPAVSGAGGSGEGGYDAKTFVMQPEAVEAALGGALGETAGGPPPAPPAAAAVSGAAAPQPPAQESPEALCEKGLGQFEKGDLGGAEQTLRRAIAASPQLPVARSTLGRVLAKAERYEEAAAELHQAVALDPADAAAFYVLGYALRRLGQDRSAADAYDRYLELTPDATEGAQIRGWIAEVRASPQMTPLDLYNQALRNYEDGNLDQALEECEEVVAVDEANGAANLLLGRILVDKGDLIRAVPALKRAEPLQPNNPEVHFYLGQAYEKRGLAEEAGSAYQRCLELGAGGPQAQYARSWLESALGGQAAAQAVTSRCEYCFRPFPPNDLSTHEGKKICADCMSNLNIAPAQRAVPQALAAGALERMAAAEAAMTGRRLAKARIGRYALLVSLSVFAVLALMLLILIQGWLSGPLKSIGVYTVLEALGLRGPFTTLGVHFPEREGPGTAQPGGASQGGIDPGVQRPPAEPLTLSVEKELFRALPLVELKAELSAGGGEGGYVFRLAKPPPGMAIDEASGVLSWTPGAVEGRFEFPRPVPVKAEVTSGVESKAVEFKIVVDFAFKLGRVLDAEVPAGQAVRLAVGKLNVSDERARDDIALAWGHYREGWLRVLYEQGAGAQFSPGPRIDLGGLPTGLVLADVTSDGRTDAVVANWATSSLLVFRQNANGTLSQEPPLPTGRGVDSLVAGDVDGDNDVDIVASHWAEPVLYVYPQEVEDNAGRLGEPESYETAGRSGWNRAFVGPLRVGPKAVYLLRGSGDSLLNVFRTKPDGTLHSYREPGPSDLLPGRPLEAMPVRLGEGRPCLAALLGGIAPALYVIGARGDDMELLSREEIEGLTDPVGMTVGDLNGDSIDDVVVLCAEEIHVLLGTAGKGGRWFVGAARLEVPLAVGPLVVGEFTHDDQPDLAVVRDDGKVQIVQAAHFGGGAE